LSFSTFKDGVSVAEDTTMLAPVCGPQGVNRDGTADFGISDISCWSKLHMALGQLERGLC